MKQPGFDKLRAQLLASAQERAEKLAEQLETGSGMDSTSAIDLARTYGELASIIEEVGQKPDALVAYRRAVHLLEAEAARSTPRRRDSASHWPGSVTAPRV